ncbi:MAG: heparan-alpha-glucosaminide N-acetyltransferase domain-containing protein, partial [Actinomycetota bacterium]
MTVLEIPAAGSTAPPKRRVLSLDAARGFAIVIMLVALHPGPRGGLPYQLTHAKWHWVTFVDTFFPLFLFAVGAAMPFSSRASEWKAVIRRVGILVLIGMVLVAAKHGSFPRGGGGVLQHIAIAYLGARVILAAPRRWQLPIVAGALAVISAIWIVAPSGDPWGRDTSLAHLVDEWIYGGFTVEGTVQSLVSIVNVMGGVVAGRLVKERTSDHRVVRTALAWAVG